MDVQHLQKRKTNALFVRNALFGVVALLVAANVLLSFSIYRDSNQVILVPTAPAKGMVARGAADTTYVEALAKDAAYALFNSSPETADYGVEVLRRMSSTRNRREIVRTFQDTMEDLRERRISTVLEMHRLETDRTGGSVRIFGVMNTYLEDALISKEPVGVLAEFVFEAGSARLARLSKFEEDS